MRRLLGLAVLVLGASVSLMAQGNNVSVYTLKNLAGVLPPVTAASPNTLFLQVPDAVLADKNGNVYLTDTGGHRVWKVDSTGKVSLVIGTTAQGIPTLGKAANTQPIGEPSGLTMDAAGNLYVSDRYNCAIYKIDTSGIVTLVAGYNSLGGVAFFSGDGQPATQAFLNVPRGMAVGPDGNLYFADTTNQRIRMVNLTTNIITTVAGSTVSGNAVNPGFGGDGGLATQARLSAPEGVAFDSLGDMFIADTGNNRIRMVSNGIITTVAGRDLTNKEKGLNDNGGPITNPVTGANYTTAVTPFPSSCTISPGNANSTRVGAPLQTTTAAGNVVCAVIGDGKDAQAALLGAPSSIVVDASNNVIFVDRGNARIRELYANPVPSGTSSFAGFSGINTIVGTGSNQNAGDGGPGRSAGISTGTNGLSLDPSGKLYFTDRTNNRARVFDTVGGIVGGFAGSPSFNGDQAALATMFFNPTGVTVDTGGNVYVTDSGNNLIRKIDTTGQVTTIAGVKTGGDAQSEAIDPLSAALNNPTGIAVDASGTIIYFADTGSNRIRRVTAGSIQTVAGCVFTRQTTASSLAQNCTFTADGLPATILKLNLSGATTQNTKRFTGVALDSKGNLVFAESGNQVVRRVTGGSVVTIAGQFGTSGLGGDGGPAVNMFLSSPDGVAVDNNGNIFVADKANFAAHMISGANGIVYPLAGQIGANTNAAETANNIGGVAVPAWGHRYRAIQGLAVDNGGNIFLADSSNNKIDRIPYAAPAACNPATTKTCPANSSQWVDYRVAGNIANTAGDFVFDYSPTTSATAVASTAQISFPTGVAVDSKGQVIFSDCANNLIRVAVPPAPAKP